MYGDTSTPDFRDLLSQDTAAAERPKGLPRAFYKGKILGHEFGKTKQKQTSFVRFKVALIECLDETVAATLREQGIDLSQKEQRRDYFITPKALYQLADMLDGVLGKEQGRNYDERIPELTGAEVQVELLPRLNQDGVDSGFNEIGTMVAA